jgi:hypothetical protein
MAANYKVLQWNSKPELMTEEFMRNYKIDTLRILPGDVKQELVRPQQGKKGLLKAAKAYNIMVNDPKSITRNERVAPLATVTGWAHGPQELERIQGHPTKDAHSDLPELHEPSALRAWAEETNPTFPNPLPYPEEEVILKDTNLYEALKYVRPGYFLMPTEALPPKIDSLPNGRIPSFDIYPVKQTKLTIVNIARFPFTANHPTGHTRERFSTIWTHFLKSVQVVGQMSWRPKAKAHGYTFDWMWDNCVHLRPEIMQRALPATTRLGLGPLTNGNEITWLVVPRANPNNYERRWKVRQRQQEDLLAAGKGMLPKPERKKLKKEVKAQLRAARNNPSLSIDFSPMGMATARLGIIRRLDLILFKYEKLLGTIKSYIGARYGRNRFLNREERSVVHALVKMPSVEHLKRTPSVYIPPRNLEEKVKSQTDSVGRQDYRRSSELVSSGGGSARDIERARPYRRTREPDAWRSNVQKDPQERIQELKRDAQDSWDNDDEPMNSLSSRELARPECGDQRQAPGFERTRFMSSLLSRDEAPMSDKDNMRDEKEVHIWKFVSNSRPQDENNRFSSPSINDGRRNESTQKKHWHRKESSYQGRSDYKSGNEQRHGRGSPNEDYIKRADDWRSSDTSSWKPRDRQSSDTSNWMPRDSQSNDDLDMRSFKPEYNPSTSQSITTSKDVASAVVRKSLPKRSPDVRKSEPRHQRKAPADAREKFARPPGTKQISFEHKKGKFQQAKLGKQKKDEFQYNQKGLSTSEKDKKSMLHAFKLDFAVARASPSSKSGPSAEP